MKRLIFAVSMLCMTTTARAQFSFNRVSCVTDVLNACVHFDATFTPSAAGTYVSMRLNVAQEPTRPNDLSALGL